MTVFDDGTGPALYLGGSFSGGRIARWNGGSVQALGGDLGSTVLMSVRALAVFNDGNGPALFAAGGFDTAGGNPANNIARWGGPGAPAWSALGSGINSIGHALAVHDEDGPGPLPAMLYAGGDFSTAGGTPANFLARWNGVSWSAVGIGLPSVVRSLHSFDDGDGPRLIAGGAFGVRQRNGTTWSTMPGGSPMFATVNALASMKEGGNTALFAAEGNGVFFDRVWRWSNGSWTLIGTPAGGSSRPNAMAVYNDGTGPALFVGGNFTSINGVPANRLAKWNGTTWSAAGNGISGDVNTTSTQAAEVFALAVFGEGSANGGSALFAGGVFMNAANGPNTLLVDSIARWNGATWSALGKGARGNPIRSMIAHDHDGAAGDGPSLFAGGSFVDVGGIIGLNRIARWDGTNWNRLGSGVIGEVNALEVFNDGLPTPNLPTLFVGGNFGTAGGLPASNIARWDGLNTIWSPLGGGVDGAVRAMTVFDVDGSGSGGPKLVVGGNFTVAGGVAVNRVAAWDGLNWAALGAGLTTPGAPTGAAVTVAALKIFDDGLGSGPMLYAAGSFSTADGVPASNIARWDPQSLTWSAVGVGIATPSIFNEVALSMTLFDDDGFFGSGGNGLFIGGTFVTAGGVAVSNIAKWNGLAWSAVGGGITAGTAGFTSVNAMLSYDDGAGGPMQERLYVTGNFTLAGGSAASRIAQWDGTAWVPLAGGVNPPFGGGGLALAAFSDGAYGAAVPSLYVGGNFGAVNGGIPSVSIARWFPGGFAPAHNQSPMSQIVMLGDTVAFGALATGVAPMNTQWFKDGVRLEESGQFQGTESNRLVITRARLADAGNYEARFTTPCGMIPSGQGTLVVNCTAPANGDLNGDGMADGADIQAFISAMQIQGPDNAVCRGDFNPVPGLDFDDLASFVQMLIN